MTSEIELLLQDEVVELTRLSDTTIWRMEQRGAFPRRIKIGQRRVAWNKAEVLAYLRERHSARPTAA